MASRSAVWTAAAALAVTLVACGETNDGPREQQPVAPTDATVTDDTTDETVDREVGPAEGSIPAMDE